MTAPGTDSAEAAELAATITIAATPAQVWALIADVERMSGWSPQVVKTKAFGKPVKLGTRFVNLNCQGWKHWPTTAQIVRFAPERDMAFRITENYTVWSFRLEEADGGTVLTHRRETPNGISTLSRVLPSRCSAARRPSSARCLTACERPSRGSSRTWRHGADFEMGKELPRSSS
jgi:uncharacterized protein YndB with AHSA1/START domain